LICESNSTQTLKTKICILGAAMVSAFSLQPSALLYAATTIDLANHYAYGANLGWMDWRGDTNNGAVIGEYVCSGYLYAANVGWINLGSGLPTNGIYYQNLSAGDFGVNQDGLGNLRGFAYGANIGWVNFENTGAPRVDMGTGRMTGYVWSANCGWISLSNAVANVQTDSVRQGALAPDGLPIAWLLTNFGTTNINAGADPDGDGRSNLQEYLAGTNPNNSADYLRITYVARGDVLPDFTTLHWTSVPTRFYTIQYRATLDGGSGWADSVGFGFGASSATFSTGSTNAAEFYRILAYRPLFP
jgi:hypothetical protein